MGGANRLSLLMSNASDWTVSEEEGVGEGDWVREREEREREEREEREREEREREEREEREREGERGRERRGRGRERERDGLHWLKMMQYNNLSPQAHHFL